MWSGRAGWEASSWRGSRGVTHSQGQDKERGPGGVPGGVDLFLRETDARSCKGEFAFNERIKLGQGCLRGLRQLPRPLPTPPRRGVS